MDARRHLGLHADHVSEHRIDSRANSRGVRPAEHAMLAVEIHLHRRANEQIVPQLKELLREALQPGETAAEPFHPGIEVLQLGRCPLWSSKPSKLPQPSKLSKPSPRPLFRHCQIPLVPIGDELPIRVGKAPDVLAVHRERERLVERPLQRGVRPPEDAERHARTLRGGPVVVHHLQGTLQAELQRKAADDPHEETVQGPDLRKVLRRDHLTEISRVNLPLLDLFGKARHEPLEDLARGSPRECERHDLLRLHAAANKLDETLRKRLRLAGPRRRLDQDIWLHRLTYSKRRPSTEHRKP